MKKMEEVQSLHWSSTMKVKMLTGTTTLMTTTATQKITTVILVTPTMMWKRHNRKQTDVIKLWRGFNIFYCTKLYTCDQTE